ncbi:TLC domain-containing protein 4 isoform X2 [Erinaceus europaeus]|uniref:TLC domain-containing protein 4 isoform X2 n=1 Tax=Erinaceus europaeus TaxID=9365 RepID=A0ABM3YAK8_ERIEU|nr:TLC domain-containing protein 4 isoform X2 [Erinaceus europaeus]
MAKHLLQHIHRTTNLGRRKMAELLQEASLRIHNKSQLIEEIVAECKAFRVTNARNQPRTPGVCEKGTRPGAYWEIDFTERYRVLEYIGNFRLLAELSSPFVNQRWFFEVLKYPKSSKANVINGILMAVVFFIVRIAVMPPFYAYLYSVYGTEPYMRLGLVIQLSWVFSCLILDVMNVIWMYRISKGCIKVILLIRREKATDHLQNGKVD